MKQPNIKGRYAEAAQIRKIMRAVSVGRLLCGEFDNWKNFLEPDQMVLESLPRRQLKAYYCDAGKRINKIVRGFCDKYFQDMKINRLEMLYERIKAHRGLELPLKEFEENYSKLNPKALNECPTHSTVVISLWGLQFKFPEDYLAKNLYTSLNEALEVHSELFKFKEKRHSMLINNREKISLMIRKKIIQLGHLYSVALI